uniref:Uncharacterized protein n=1 Tax=Ananas comosus var. bracteatus TaxID=296719 RepID=A0A6V7PPJ0_ANACO|nr:unnamed protein product [Ananas comosus var. bracteatus]
MSLDLAVKYADVIHSVVLQASQIPRFFRILYYLRNLPCLLFFVCMRDTFTSEERKLKDPTRLYAPGRMFHIVERKFCRCGRFPPEVRTAIPVEGRFEHIVLSCNAIFDHGIIWTEREAQKALELMEQREETTTPPSHQSMERTQFLAKERSDAVEIATRLNAEQQMRLSEEESTRDIISGASSCSDSSSSSGRSDWDEMVEKLLINTDESDDLTCVQNIDISCCNNWDYS